MLCDEMIELISLYIDNIIDDGDKRKVEKHISQCNECNDYFIMINDIKNNLNQLQDVELPQNFHNDAMQKLKSELKIDNTNNIKQYKTFNFKMWGSIAAATTIALIGVNFAIKNFNPVNPGNPEVIEFNETDHLIRSNDNNTGVSDVVDDMFNLESVIWYDANMTLNKDYFDDINYVLEQFGIKTDINGGHFEVYSEAFIAMKTEIENISSNVIVNFSEVENDSTDLYNEYKQELRKRRAVRDEMIEQNVEQIKVDDAGKSIIEVENLIMELDSKNDYYMLNINFE